jgi:hypothetical protein
MYLQQVQGSIRSFSQQLLFSDQIVFIHHRLMNTVFKKGAANRGSSFLVGIYHYEKKPSRGQPFIM